MLFSSTLSPCNIDLSWPLQSGCFLLLIAYSVALSLSIFFLPLSTFSISLFSICERQSYTNLHAQIGVLFPCSFCSATKNSWNDPRSQSCCGNACICNCIIKTSNMRQRMWSLQTYRRGGSGERHVKEEKSPEWDSVDRMTMRERAKDREHSDRWVYRHKMV